MVMSMKITWLETVTLLFQQLPVHVILGGFWDVPDLLAEGDSLYLLPDLGKVASPPNNLWLLTTV